MVGVGRGGGSVRVVGCGVVCVGCVAGAGAGVAGGCGWGAGGDC